VKPKSTPKFFVGNYLMSVDSKNRIVLPPIFRDILKVHYKDDNNSVVASLSIEGNINVHQKARTTRWWTRWKAIRNSAVM